MPVVILSFLVAADFFGSWNGHVVSKFPATSENPSSYRVLIVEQNGRDRLERSWPAGLVGPLGLPVDAYGIPPDEIPEERPRTRKSPYALHFLLQIGEEWRTVPTTTPSSLGVAFLVLVLGIAVRNMIVAGSPFSLEPQGLTLPKGQVPSGQAAPTRGSRSQKGPPPPRRRRGAGRR